MSINNRKKAVKDYINRDKLIYKRYTYNKIGHLTKNCKLKDRLYLKCNKTNCSGTCPKFYGSVPTVMATIVLFIGDALQ